MLLTSARRFGRGCVSGLPKLYERSVSERASRDRLLKLLPPDLRPGPVCRPPQTRTKDVPQTPTSPYGQQAESLSLAIRSGTSPRCGNLLWTTLLKLWMRRSLLDCDRRLRLRRRTTRRSCTRSCGCSEPRLPRTDSPASFL